MLFMGSYRASRQPCMGSAGNGSGTQARGPPAGRHGRAQARSRTRYSNQPPLRSPGPAGGKAARRAAPLASAVHESAVVRGRTVTRCGLRAATTAIALASTAPPRPSPAPSSHVAPSFQPSPQLPKTCTA